MKKLFFIALLISSATTVAQNLVPAKSVEPVRLADPKAPEIAKPSDLLNGIIEDYVYVPQGKRDPFAPFDFEVTDSNALGPLFPLQKYDLEQLKLVGIIWEVKQPKAMIMDPMGSSHVVKVNDRVGRSNGYVARIREGEIVVIESFKDSGKISYQTQVMKLGSQ